MKETPDPKSWLQEGDKCRRCGELVPPHAPRCPNCGMPARTMPQSPQRKRWKEPDPEPEESDDA